MRKIVLSLSLLFSSYLAYADEFTIESADIKPNGSIKFEQVLNGFGCTGNNISPALSWKNPPKATKSFALLVHDPDARTGGSGWWHWVVINIPATTTALPSGAGKSDGTAMIPGATQVATDLGTTGWDGPWTALTPMFAMLTVSRVRAIQRSGIACWYPFGYTVAHEHL